MRELVITNIQIVCDAQGDDPTTQAHRVLHELNAYADKVGGSPQIFIMSEPIATSYRDNGEEDGDLLNDMHSTSKLLQRLEHDIGYSDGYEVGFADGMATAQKQMRSAMFGMQQAAGIREEQCE